MSGRGEPPVARNGPRGKLRTREYLTEAEVERLMAAASNRYGHRDATMVFAAYRHGLRASELVDLLGAGRLQNGDPVIRQARQQLAAVAGRDDT